MCPLQKKKKTKNYNVIIIGKLLKMIVKGSKVNQRTQSYIIQKKEKKKTLL